MFPSFKKLKTRYNKYYQSLVNFGITKHTKDSEIKHIKLLNIFCWFWHLRNIITLINDFALSKFNIHSLYDFIIFTCTVATIQTLQYYKKFMAARLLFVFSIMLSSFIFGVFIYPGNNIELNFVLVPGATLIIFKNKTIIKSIILFSFLAVLTTIYVLGNKGLFEYDYFMITVIYISVYVMINYFKELNLKSELFLQEKSQQLEELNRFKSQFFTNISHEIRTPLTLIKGEIDFLKDEKLSNDKIEAIHQNANNQIKSITSIVNTVMDLAKMESSNFELNPKITNISSLLDKIQINFQRIFQQKNIEFYTETESKDFYANIDVVFFERAINNLLNNAYKYTEKGKVIIKTTEVDSFLKIDIIDTGIGISKKNSKNIFNSFYQVDNDINKTGGSGIGLSFCKEIIKLHQGEITVQSTPNEGSCFTISIPLLNPQHKPLKKTKPDTIEINTIKNSSITFLIVDDNADMRKYLSTILNDYNSILVANGEQALEILNTNEIDFIITDYMMPKMDGLGLSKKLKELHIDIPTIMITAKTSFSAKQEILSLGVKDYITKPFEKNELITSINNLLDKHIKKVEYNKENQINTFNNDESELLLKIQEHINSNSNSKELTQDFLTDKFNISKSSLYRHIKSSTGLTPKEFITEVRLQKARTLLEENPNILLKQLSLEVGFSHTSYFSKLYEKRFGNKPK